MRCNNFGIVTYNIIAIKRKKVVNPAIKLEVEKGGLEFYSNPFIILSIRN